MAWERLKPPAQCRQLAKLFDIVNVFGQIAAGLRWIPRYATGFCRKANGERRREQSENRMGKSATKKTSLAAAAEKKIKTYKEFSID